MYLKPHLQLFYGYMQEEAAVLAREEEERRRHEAHLKKLQGELEAKKEAERRYGVLEGTFFGFNFGLKGRRLLLNSLS